MPRTCGAGWRTRIPGGSGGSRAIRDLFAQAEFRQDLGKFAWGATLSGGSDFAFYRLDEIDHFHKQYPQTSAFAEYRPDAKTTVTFQVRNLTSIDQTRDRRFFDPSRSNPNPFQREVRVRNQHVIPQLTIKRAFG